VYSAPIVAFYRRSSLSLARQEVIKMKKFLWIGIFIAGAGFLPHQATAGTYQQRVITTTTVVGAAAGAVIGADSHQAVQGALIGGVFGAAVGMLMAQNEPARTYAPVYRSRPVHHRGYRQVVYTQPVYTRPVNARHEHERHLRSMPYAHQARVMHAYYHPQHARRIARHHAMHEYREHEAREHGYRYED